MPSRIWLTVFRSTRFIVAAGLFCSMPALAQGKRGPDGVSYANPLVGTAPLDNQTLIGNAPPEGEPLYSGFVPPGPLLPHGPFELGPVNSNIALQYDTGINWPYFYSNPAMFGFSAGGPGGPMLMPVVGDWTVPPNYTPSAYNKGTEKASPGYYAVDLDSFHTRVELTATLYTGLYRFTFPAAQKASVVINIDRASGQIEVVDDHTVRGVVDFGNGDPMNGNGRQAFFVAEFSKPFRAFGTFKRIPATNLSKGRIIGNDDVLDNERTVTGSFAGAYLRFTTTAGEQVLVKVAHGQSYAQAEQRLRQEQPGFDFDAVHQRAVTAWTTLLDKIEVEGGTDKQKTLFYSTLLHSFTSPRLLARKGETYIGLDHKEHVAEHDRYGPVPFWDTGRNQIVLLTLLEPSVKEDILASQLDMARESGYMGTSFHGDNAVFMYLGDWERGLTFDRAGVYEYLSKNATDPAGPRHYLAEYIKNGWISDVVPPGNPSPPYAGGKAGAATTLEYAWDDYAMSQYAKKLGKDDDAAMFLKRASNYKNVFDPSTGFMRGRTEDGAWALPAAGPDKGRFDPGEPYYNFMMKEASGWSTLWLVPHDISGLTALLGGREKAIAKLDEFFATPYTATGVCRDCTGHIGQYVQGNQPDQQAAYLYDWLGQPWKTQELSRRILREMYGSDYSGYAYPGMDDQGSTSSWYVLSAMGFYTVDPSSPIYAMGSPLFRRIRLHMGNGKVFEIVANNNSDKNMYIQSATLNGKPWNKPWFSHADIADGGTLMLSMGPTPNKQWGSAPDAAPPSMSR